MTLAAIIFSHAPEWVDVLLPMPALRIVFAALLVISALALVERLVLRPRGVVLGIPVKILHEDFEGRLREPDRVDLGSAVGDMAKVKWLSPRRLLLVPRAQVNMHASASDGASTSSTKGGGWMFVAVLTIEEGHTGVVFHGRVLLRLGPLIGAVVFVIAPYLPLPWGMDWYRPNMPSWMAVAPLLLFGGVLAWAIFSARGAVESAYHAVTAAFVAAIERPL